MTNLYLFNAFGVDLCYKLETRSYSSADPLWESIFLVKMSGTLRQRCITNPTADPLWESIFLENMSGTLWQRCITYPTADPLWESTFP